MMDARQLLSISRFPPGRAIWCRLAQGDQPIRSLAIETAASAPASRTPRITAPVTSQGMLYQPPRDYLRRTGTLFGCACVRRYWQLLSDERSHRAVEVAERFTDSQASEGALNEAYQGGEDVARVEFLRLLPEANAESAAALVACPTRPYDSADAAARYIVSAISMIARNDQATSDPSAPERAWFQAKEAEQAAQVGLVRCVFGNPFAAQQPIDSAVLRWNDGTVLRIASGIYEERAFERLPVLADALLDAGCDDEAMLEHCRQQEGVHAKGCWVIDLLLGKS